MRFTQFRRSSLSFAVLYAIRSSSLFILVVVVVVQNQQEQQIVILQTLVHKIVDELTDFARCGLWRWWWKWKWCWLRGYLRQTVRRLRSLSGRSRKPSGNGKLNCYDDRQGIERGNKNIWTRKRPGKKAESNDKKSVAYENDRDRGNDEDVEDGREARHTTLQRRGKARKAYPNIYQITPATTCSHYLFIAHTIVFSQTSCWGNNCPTNQANNTNLIKYSSTHRSMLQPWALSPNQSTIKIA